jgi:hypothetical protein
MFRRLCALGLLLRITLVVAQDNRPEDPNNHFVYPPLPGGQYSNDNTVFWSNINITVGEAQAEPFKWVTNMTSMRISLQQEGNPNSTQGRILTGNSSQKVHILSTRLIRYTDCEAGVAPEANYLYWDGNISPIDLKNGSQAYLAAWNCSAPGTTPVFFSHYVNLTEPAAASSSSSASSTAAATNSETNTAAPSSSAPSSATPVPASSGGSSSNAAALGGGIGGGIGGAIILTAAAFAFWKYRQSQQAKQRQQYQGGTYHMGQDSMHQGYQQSYPKPPYSDQTMSSRPSPPAELPPGHDGAYGVN